MEITEYQIIRPSGIVLLSMLVPDGQSFGWGEHPGDPIRGPIITRWRVLPSGPWTVVAYYPDGLGSTPVPWEATALLPGGIFPGLMRFGLAAGADVDALLEDTGTAPRAGDDDERGSGRYAELGAGLEVSLSGRVGFAAEQARRDRGKFLYPDGGLGWRVLRSLREEGLRVAVAVGHRAPPTAGEGGYGLHRR